MPHNLPAYNFPETKFVEENSLGDQLDHILSEIAEISHAVLDKYDDLEEACKDDHVLEELGDLEGSLETFWRKLKKLRGQKFVSDVFRGIEEKNDVRGYYKRAHAEACVSCDNSWSAGMHTSCHDFCDKFKGKSQL